MSPASARKRFGTSGPSEVGPGGTLADSSADTFPPKITGTSSFAQTGACAQESSASPPGSPVGCPAEGLASVPTALQPEAELDMPAVGRDADFWSERAGRPVTRRELYEIETGLIGLFELLLRTKRGGTHA